MSTKWTSLAGPRQTKQVDQAIRDLQSLLRSYRQITDYGEHVFYSPFSPPKWDAPTKALDAIGAKYDHVITRENYRDVLSDLTEARTTLSKSLPVEDTRTTQEERDKLAAERAERDAKNKAEAEAHASAKAKAVAEIRQQYPWAEPPGKLSEPARAAKNIRTELSKAFHGVKFSVTSDRYSMGNSVDVRWTDGPTPKQVREITGKYQGGYFNGMEDIYEYDRSAYGAAVSDVLGQAKYVSEQRNYTDGLREQVERWLCEKYGKTYDPINGVCLSECDPRRSSDVAWQVLNISTLPHCCTPNGIQQCDEFPWWTVTYEMPERPQVERSNDGEWAQVQKHHHSKRGFDFYLCVPNERLEEEAFEAKREACEALGGWYSRKWGRTPGGFAFKEEDVAMQFAGRVGEPALIG